MLTDWMIAAWNLVQRLRVKLQSFFHFSEITTPQTPPLPLGGSGLNISGLSKCLRYDDKLSDNCYQKCIYESMNGVNSDLSVAAHYIH